MRYFLFFFLICYLPVQSYAQYKIVDTAGKKLSLKRLARKLSKEADVVLFGEFHDDSTGHVLEHQLAERLYKHKEQNLVVGGEFMEADDQIILDEYLRGLIEYRHFALEAKLWQNFEPDYKPLVDFSRQHKLPFIATNIPRRYASIVARLGLDSLYKVDSAAFEWMVPLPFEVDTTLPGYQAFYEMGHMGGSDVKQMIYAQAIKDATMAHFIVRNLPEGALFYHVNGAYHSNNYEGIYWYLKKYAPGLEVVTLSMKAEGDTSVTADYMIMVPKQ